MYLYEHNWLNKNTLQKSQKSFSQMFNWVVIIELLIRALTKSRGVSTSGLFYFIPYSSFKQLKYLHFHRWQGSGQESIHHHKAWNRQSFLPSRFYILCQGTTFAKRIIQFIRKSAL
jgi:hypothetical protein